MAYPFTAPLPSPNPILLHDLHNPSSSSSPSSKIPTSRVSLKDAASLLSTFLHRSTTDAAYRPDSTLSHRGPQASLLPAGGGGNPNLTLKNLEKVRDGVEGKVWKREDLGGKGKEEFFGDIGFFGMAKERGDRDGRKGKKRKRGGDDGGEREGKGMNKRKKDGEKKMKIKTTKLKGGDDDEGDGKTHNAEEEMEKNEEEGWQDPVSFEHEQDVEEGDLGERNREPQKPEPEEVQVAEPPEDGDGDVQMGDGVHDEDSTTPTPRKPKKDKKSKKRKKEAAEDVDVEMADANDEQSRSTAMSMKKNKKTGKSKREARTDGEGEAEAEAPPPALPPVPTETTKTPKSRAEKEERKRRKKEKAKEEKRMKNRGME